MASSSSTERKLPGWLLKAAASADQEWGEGEKGKAGPNTPTKGRGPGRKRMQNGGQGSFRHRTLETGNKVAI